MAIALTDIKNATSIADRFWPKVDLTGDCWDWTGAGANTGLGYGFVGVRRLDGRKTTMQAHRIVWELLVGPIPDGYEIDHQCFRPKCVNPDHLEPVLPQVNKERQRWSGAKFAMAKTHCPNGHEYTGDNLVVDTTSFRDWNVRRCVTCRSAQMRSAWRKSNKKRAALRKQQEEYVV